MNAYQPHKANTNLENWETFSGYERKSIYKPFITLQSVFKDEPLTPLVYAQINAKLRPAKTTQQAQDKLPKIALLLLEKLRKGFVHKKGPKAFS